MSMPFSTADDVLKRAHQKTQITETSVNQAIREPLSGKVDSDGDAAEFERLSRLAHGDSRGWKFDRDELHAQI